MRDRNDLYVMTDFNTRSFRSVILFLNDIPLAEGGGGTRFYATEALKHLKQNDKGQWTCESSALADMVTMEVPADAGKMLTFDQTLVHEVRVMLLVYSLCRSNYNSVLSEGKSNHF